MLCNVCVQELDHHCPFVSNCIGKRNYGYFWGFICFLMLNCFFVNYVAIDDTLKRINADKNKSVIQVLRRNPMSIVFVVISGFTFMLIVALIGYHCRLTLMNQTTNEAMKRTFNHYQLSPFETGSVFSNLKSRIFKKRLPEIFKPRELYSNQPEYKEPAIKTPKKSEIQHV